MGGGGGGAAPAGGGPASAAPGPSRTYAGMLHLGPAGGGIVRAPPPPPSLSSLSLYDETLSIYLSIYLSISRTHTQGHTHIHSLPPAPHTPAQTNIAALQRPAGATVSV